jgi:acetyl esterase/lipase
MHPAFAGLVLVSAASLTLWLSGCSPLTALNAVVPKDGYTSQEGIAYGPADRNRLDIHVPKTHVLKHGDGPAPVVVFFYGGSWKFGSRQQYRFMGEALTSRGYVAVVPDYRVYPNARFPMFVEDGADAVRWVHDHIAEYGGDPERIYLMGHSAGAYITAQLSLNPRYLGEVGLSRDDIKGMVGLAGPYATDLRDYDSVRAIFVDHPEPGDLKPITFVDGQEPPMLLMHGGDDTTVYPANSVLLAQEIQAAGGDAEYVEFEDKGHIGMVLGLAKPFRRDGGALDRAARFINNHAGGS